MKRACQDLTQKEMTIHAYGLAGRKHHNAKDVTGVLPIKIKNRHMKNTIKHIILLLVVFSITLISCEKETDDDENPDNTATCRIKTVNPSDDIATTYNYNTDNNLISITSSGGVFEITYNADSRISAVSHNDGTEPLTATYEYNADGLPETAITDTGSGGGITTTTYFFTNNKLTKKENVMTDGLGNTVKGIVTYTYLGDNIIKTVYDGYVNGSLSFSTTYTYEYDNKKNPLYDLNIQYTVVGTVENFALFASKNNYTSMSASTGGTVTQSFEYNTNNYPSKITYADGSYATATYYPCE